MKDWIVLAEAADPVVTTALALVKRAQERFGKDELAHGNCAEFAYALASELKRRFPGEEIGLCAVLLGRKNEPDTDIADSAGEMNHTMVLLSRGSQIHLFDGSGEVSEADLDEWMSMTHRCRIDSEAKADGFTEVRLATGEATPKTLAALRGWTDHTITAKQFARVLAE